ncbi:hypothetical protein R50073_28630 [Maricurvus nonylphenolicus]|uniref:hypothetical protein n=1 Tax=Maricurvus nonylphenolicus TaxID=1008307 RepID=UPI0036F39968
MSDKRPSPPEELSDQALSELYQQASSAKSPTSLDDKVMARAAEQADRIRHTSRYAEVRRPVFLARQWVTLAATACVITLSISLVIQMPDEQPWLDSRIEDSVEERAEGSGESTAVLESESVVIAERKQVQPAMKARMPDAPPKLMQQAPKRERLEEVVVLPEAPQEAEAAVSAFADSTDAPSQVQEYDQEESVASPEPAIARSLSLEKTKPAKPQWQPQQWLEEILALWQSEKQEEAKELFGRYKEAFPSESTLKQTAQRMTQKEQEIINQLQRQWQQAQQKRHQEQ